MKQCSICKKTKNITEFYKRKRSTDGYAAHCILCKNNIDRQYYLNNKEKFRKRNRQHIQSNYLKLFEYLSQHPCVDCGQSNALVLEFDHLDGKESCVTTLIGTGVAWTRVQKEIDKCEVRCSSCHTIITHKRANTSRWQYYINYIESR